MALSDERIRAPGLKRLIQRASRHGWGANVELLEYYWLLTWWAPK